MQSARILDSALIKHRVVASVTEPMETLVYGAELAFRLDDGPRVGRSARSCEALANAAWSSGG